MCTHMCVRVQVSVHRSMLQLARVHLNHTSGWLQANRSELFQLTLQPPPNAPPPPQQVLPKVWAVSRVDAAAIALAEIARWVDLSPPPPGELTTDIVGGYKLAESSYAARPQPSVVACVAACGAEANCSAVTFCAKRNGQRYCTCSAATGSESASTGSLLWQADKSRKRGILKTVHLTVI